MSVAYWRCLFSLVGWGVPLVNFSKILPMIEPTHSSWILILQIHLREDNAGGEGIEENSARVTAPATSARHSYQLRLVFSLWKHAWEQQLHWLPCSCENRFIGHQKANHGHEGLTNNLEEWAHYRNGQWPK
jgi:hypothetical protein